jgi:hypothetical protein
MTNLDRRRYDMLTRIRNFGVAHRQLFPEKSTAHAAFIVVNSEVERLEALDVAERLASHSARAARKAAARKVLFDCLTRAKNTARVLAKTVPQLSAHLEMPGGVDDRLLLTIARQFAAGVAPHADHFSAHGIALELLTELIEAFETALNERGTQRDEQVQARARLEASLGRALEAVEILDVAVPNHLATDQGILAAWKRDRRLYRSRRPRTDAAPEPQAPAPVAGNGTPVVPFSSLRD